MMPDGFARSLLVALSRNTPAFGATMSKSWSGRAGQVLAALSRSTSAFNSPMSGRSVPTSASVKPLLNDQYSVLLQKLAAAGFLPPVPLSPARRGLDLLIAGTTFILGLPLLAAIAFLIWVTSPGPILFRQERIGQGGVPFTLLKFRTMRVGTSGPNVTASDDSRLTPIGKLLRLVGLDELPQLINILKGEMTLVGPRPEVPALAARYPAPYRGVFRYRPGLTGPAALRLPLPDNDRLGSSYEDLESYYLKVVVPAKVAADLGFLATATLPSTLRLVGQTLLYVITGNRTWRPRARHVRQVRKRVDQHYEQLAV